LIVLIAVILKMCWDEMCKHVQNIVPKT